MPAKLIAVRDVNADTSISAYDDGSVVIENTGNYITLDSWEVAELVKLITGVQS